MTLRSIFQKKKSSFQTSNDFETYQGSGSQRAVNQHGDHNSNPEKNKNQQEPGGGYGYYVRSDLSQLHVDPTMLLSVPESVSSVSQQWKQHKILNTEEIDFNSRRKREINSEHRKRVGQERFQTQLHKNDGHGSPSHLYNYTNTSQYQLRYQQQQHQQQQQLLNKAVSYLQGLPQLAQYLQNNYSGAAKDPTQTEIRDYYEQFLQNVESYGHGSNTGNLSRSHLALVLRALVCLIAFCSSPLLGVLVVISCFWPEECADIILKALMTSSGTNNKPNQRSGTGSQELVPYTEMVKY
jgi:hypothetical protein